MLKLVLFYCLCQLVVQGFLYLSIRGFLAKSVYRIAYIRNWSNKQIIKRYNIIGLIINSIITAFVILVTARASMVGTANLLASTILTIFIYFDSLVIVLEYKRYKDKKDKETLNKKRLLDKLNDKFEPIEIPESLLKGDNND